MTDPKDISRLEEENVKLKRALRELAILNEISTAISSTLSLNQIIDLMVQKCIKHLNVEQAAVMLLEENAVNDPLKTMIRVMDTTENSLPYHLNTQLTGWMLNNQKPLLINDCCTDDHFNLKPDENFPVKSLLCVPLMRKGKMIGLLSTFNKKDEAGFNYDDQRLLSIIAAQSAQVIDNARLLEEEQALMNVKKEMALAYEIQSKLLPEEAPDIPGYDIAGISIPAKTVGGDYFDFIPIENNRIAVALGDVSGKGLPAAMLMSNLQAMVKGFTILKHSPKDCLGKSNELLYKGTDVSKFVTLFYGVLDAKDHTFCYSNAGHNHPFFFSKDKAAIPVEESGIVLGVLEDFNFTEGKIEFHPNDLLLVYSDGITEAIDAEEEEFGEKRLAELVDANKERGAQEIIDIIINAVNEFASGLPQRDDTTLVVIKRV